MLPKIFHDIMIDDFIEGGKFYNQNSSFEFIDENFNKIMGSSQNRIDIKELMRYVKKHE